MFGSPETTTGGNALKFYASLRLDVRYIGKVGKKEDPVGVRSRVKVVKNKLGRPFVEAEFDIGWGTGIDRSGEILDHGMDLGVVTRAGHTISYGETKLGVGRANAIQFLDANPEVANDAYKKVLAASHAP